MLKANDSVTLRLFNAVETIGKTSANLFLKDTVPFGFILQPEVAARDDAKEIISAIRSTMLSGQQMNSSFHKSWSMIENSTREELLAHQLMHYFSTYGLQELGLFSENTVYIPNEVLNLPEGNSLPLKVIKGMTREQLTEKALDLLRSGVALKEETVDEVLDLLNSYSYQFETIDDIKNKEAKIKISLKYNIFPSESVEFLRLMVYKATKSALIIKSKESIASIHSSGVLVEKDFKTFGLEKLSSIFLRFKPLFLAFKTANKANRPVINRLRKLAVDNHTTIGYDYLNHVTSMPGFHPSDLYRNLEKANAFRKIRLLYALHIRLQEVDSLLYKVRNGKTWVKKAKAFDKESLQQRFNIVYSSLVESLNLKGVKVKYPKQVDYAIPATEKQFIGNIPTGTAVNFDHDGVVGIYWENEWGANDLDFSALSIGGKIGWNSDYKNLTGSIMFSGDMTNADNGASELLYIKTNIAEPHLLVNNIFRGVIGTRFRIFVGQEKITTLTRGHMIDPNNVLLQVETTMNSKQKAIGLVIPTETGSKFVLADFGTAGGAVSNGYSEKDKMITNYMFHLYNNPITLRGLLVNAGVEFVEEGAEIDLSPENLEKDTILNLLKTK